SAGALVLQFCCDPAIGLAKWNPFAHHQPVGLFGRMDRGVEADPLRAEAHGGEGGREDVECLLREVDAAEQGQLQQLQIALVTRWQLGAYPERFQEASLRGGSTAANQLEDVRVALLRHDRGAGGEGLGQLEKTELLGVENQYVRGEAAEVLHEERDLEEQSRFRLAAR